MRPISLPRWEQLDLFTPISDRLRWSQIPDQERAEIVRLLAEALIQRARSDGRTAGEPLEVSHE